MPYLKTQDIAVISLSASLWGILNSTISPLFFQISGLPFLCDIMGFCALALTVWWTRKLGSATMVGLTATIINFIINPAGVIFLGFTAASVIFDLAIWAIRYDRVFSKSTHIAASIVPASFLSAAVAGSIIGTFFMASPALVKWGGVLGWAALHAAGGIVGGILGFMLIATVARTKIQDNYDRSSYNEDRNARSETNVPGLRT